MVDMHKTAANCPGDVRRGQGRAVECDVGPEASIERRMFRDGIDVVLPLFPLAVVEERINVVDLMPAFGQYELKTRERTSDLQDP